MWIFLFLAIVSLIASLREFRAGRTAYFVHYIIGNMIFIYAVVPVLNYYFQVGQHKYFSLFFQNDIAVLYSSLLVFVFFFFFYIGIRFGRKKHGYFIYISNKLDGRTFIWFIFLIAFCAFALYIYLTGRGVTYIFENASKLRSGTDDAKNYGAAFFKIFSYYIELVVFYYFSKLYFLENNRKFSDFIFFAFFFILAIIKAFADGGRGGMINLIVGLIFIAIIAGRLKTIQIGQILIGICLAGFIGIYGKIFLLQIFSANPLIFSDVESQDLLDGIVVEYAHQFSSLLMAVDKNLGFERAYMDLFVWLVKPFKLVGFEIPDSVSYFNTYHATGIWDSEIPPGIIVLNYYQGSVIGVILGGLFFGYLIKFIDGLIKNTLLHNNSPISFAFCAIFFIYVPFFFINSDPALFVQWTLQYIILIIILFILNKVRIKKILIK